jgi:oligopeptide/dipeptide ABC transporter ATP-binding protein
MSALAEFRADEGSGLRIADLTVAYRTAIGQRTVLSNINLEIRRGEVLALVGESGSGKSTLAYTVLRYLPAGAVVQSGSVEFDGRDLLSLGAHELRGLRGKDIGIVYQDPSTALNPTMTLGRQLLETVVRQQPGLGLAESTRRAEALLRRVQLADPTSIMARFPHQVSGGEKQRVMIAMAIAGRPSLLIFDEPTSALDATTAAEIIDLIKDVQAEYRTAILYITHDLSSVSTIADRVAVIYAGAIMEEGDARAVLRHPAHPYTRILLESVPNPFAGSTRRRFPFHDAIFAQSKGVTDGCRFRNRCPSALEKCAVEPRIEAINAAQRVACVRRNEPISKLGRTVERATFIQRDLDAQAQPLLSIRNLTVVHGHKTRLQRLFRAGDERVSAVDRVDLDLYPGGTTGLVGESGCGKSSLARALVGLLPSSGSLVFDGKPLREGAYRDKAFRRDVQIIFQHPDQALNPRMRVGDALKRPLKLYRRNDDAALDHRIAELLEQVHLPAVYAQRFPHQLSGGEKQRVAIARAFAGNPRLVICDEITSGLDVSVQASIVNLLADLQDRLGTAYLFITHDLNLIQHIADEIAVMYLGRVVERRTVKAGFQGPPYHPYSEALLSAAPAPDPRIALRRIHLGGEPSARRATATGCGFEPRCHRRVGDVCKAREPELTDKQPGCRIACHISPDELAAVPPIWSAESNIRARQ